MGLKNAVWALLVFLLRLYLPLISAELSQLTALGNGKKEIVGLDCCDYPLNDPPTFQSELSLVLGSSQYQDFLLARKILELARTIIALGTSTTLGICNLNTENRMILPLRSFSLHVNSPLVDKTKFLTSFHSRRVTTDSLETKTLINRLVELGQINCMFNL